MRFPRKPRSKARLIRSHSHGIIILRRSGKVPKETEIDSEAYKESLQWNNYSQEIW